MLHPFFSYFGSKYRLAKFYPSPKFSVIVEPFAGSGGYSLMYPDRNIFLYEISKPIVDLWNYLINVKEEEILSLPIGPFNKENPIDSLDVHPAAKLLMGFWLTESQTSASRYPLSKSRGGNWTERKKKLIASQLSKIRHWKIEHKSFEMIENREATWFIDPPYQRAGIRYRDNKINYSFLADWAKSRIGQVIVCEQEGATWLDFKNSVRGRNASNKQYQEVFWQND